MRSRKIEGKTPLIYAWRNSSCFLMKFFIQYLLFKRKWGWFFFFFLLIFAFMELLQDRRRKELVLKTGHNFKDKISPFLLHCARVPMKARAPWQRQTSSAPQTWLAAPWVTHAWKTPSHTGTSVTWSVYSGTANQTGLSLRSLIPGLNPQAMNF